MCWKSSMESRKFSVVTKPQTYPEKIQALNSLVSQQEETIVRLEKQVAGIPALNNEIESLKGKLLASSKEDTQETGASKAKQTDLVQRAESAEQALRNYQTVNIELRKQVEALESQLDLLGKNELKLVDLNNKNQMLVAQLQEANNRHTRATTNSSDKIKELEGENANVMRALMEVRRERDHWYKELLELNAAIREAANPIAQLKERVG